MRSYAPRIAVCLLAFANGVACVALLDGSARHLLGIARGLLLFASVFVPSGICFSQVFPRKRGAQGRASYGLLTISLCILLFGVGAFSFFILLLFGSSL